MRNMYHTALVVCFVLFTFMATANADVRLPAIFGSNMVLQTGQPNRIWGWADPDEKVIVSLEGQTIDTKADDDGHWQIVLPSMEVGGPHQVNVTGENKITFDNVMVGEVWICSGQSNMQWAVQQSNDADLEALTANFPNIRLISVPQVGTQEPQNDFKGSWQVCTPEVAKQFSAVGYFFGRQLHQTLNVPIGLIDNAWGGSAAEAWVNRETLASDERFRPLLERWKETEARAESEPDAQNLRRQMAGNHRPSNIYNGVLKPTIGYGIRGVIWYQGESNAGRAYQYRDLFPLMIQSWRDEWGQGDFPFYWVQLADFQQEKQEPGDSDWAELREAQTMTMSKLPNTGEAVILNLGEAVDIHPKNKLDVAKRLARWALAKDYGYEDLVHHSPQYASMEKEDAHVVLTFEHIGGGMDTFDVNEPRGFTIAGEDKVFHVASAEIVGRGRGRSQIKVWSDEVPEPVAVRYAWANNPVCNVQNVEGLPLTPFRTDSWPGVTVDKH